MSICTHIPPQIFLLIWQILQKFLSSSMVLTSFASSHFPHTWSEDTFHNPADGWYTNILLGSVILGAITKKINKDVNCLHYTYLTCHATLAFNGEPVIMMLHRLSNLVEERIKNNAKGLQLYEKEWNLTKNK